MKKLFFLSIAIAGLFFSGCEQDLPQQDLNELQDVTFNIGTGEGGLLKSEMDCSLNADYALLTILDETTEEVQTLNVPTFYVNEILYTQAIKLPPGDYTLQEFALYQTALDANDPDILVSASPHTGSVYGDLIANPVELGFEVSAFTKSEILVGVYCFEAKDFDNFGFVWFKPVINRIRESLFFGDFCAPEFDAYKGSLYGEFPRVDMPAIFQIILSEDSNNDGTYDTDLGTFNNETGYDNNEDDASAVPLSITYIDQPDVDDHYKMEVWIYELETIDPITGFATFAYKWFENWYFTNDTEVMYKDAAYRTDPTGLESVGPGTDGIYDFIVGPCIIIEWDIDLDDPDYGDGEGNETAYAKGDPSDCFLEYGFHRWGWTNVMNNTPGATYELPIWAAAGQCDTDKGTHVGTLVVVVGTGNTATVTYNMFNGFTLKETQLYVGGTLFPLSNGGWTVASGQFPYKNENLDGASSDTHNVDLPSDGTFNLIAHSVVMGTFN